MSVELSEHVQQLIGRWRAYILAHGASEEHVAALEGQLWDHAAGLGDAATGSEQLAAGLITAADGGAALPAGATKLSVEGTSKLVESGKSTASDYGLK